jgi:site-specific recombinase XerD
MSGQPLSVIKEVLGHKTIVTTQRYVHHSVESKKAAVDEVFGNILNK